MSNENKTRPCPACDTELKLPTQYLDAVRKMRKGQEAFIPVIELDFRHRLLEKMEKMDIEFSKVVDERFWETI